MPFAEGNGQRLYYEVHGAGDPLLLIGGLGCDHLTWSLQLPALAQHFKTVVFDNRDSGQSSQAAGTYHVSHLALDALALANELELEQFHLLGGSLGGAIAQELALSSPDRVSTLTLCMTWAGSGPWGVERARLSSAQARRTPREELADTMMLMTLSEEFYERPDAVAYLRRMTVDNVHPQSTEAFVRQVDAGGRHETRRRLPSLQMPVHVIGAERDMLVPVWKSVEIAELIPGAKLTVLEGASHGIAIEDPERFNRPVLDFLTEPRARRPDAPQRVSASERTTAS
jgi:3-oxoadipate enol-lactonase